LVAAALPAPAFPLAAAAAGGHGAVIVSTAAPAGTSEAEAAAFFGPPSGIAIWACPQAALPTSTHTSQLLRIAEFLQMGSVKEFRTGISNRST
jgi:hypothetical protein